MRAMPDDLDPRPATPAYAMPRDADDVHRGLGRIVTILRRGDRVEAGVARQQHGETDERHRLVEAPTHRPVDADLEHALERLHPADVAHVLEALSTDDRLRVWRHIKSDDSDVDSGAVLLELSEGVRESLVASMTPDEMVAAAEELDVDELADLAVDLPPLVFERLSKALTPEEREQVRAAMSFPEDSVGARMDFEMVTIRDDVTLEVVLRYLRRFDELPDQCDQVFVVDRDERLMGSLSLDRLLVNEPDTAVAAVMRTDSLILRPDDDADDAAQAFERYDLVSAPVVDVDGRLVGRLTVNEVVDVIREASEEAQLSAAGLSQEEDIFAPIGASIRNRAPWLLLNLVTASVASFVASRFEGTVGQIVILAFLMSIVAGIGGNSGNQTMTLIIRALALGRIGASNVRQLVVKELTVSLTIALGGGLIAGGFAWVLSGRLAIWPVMTLAMLANIMVGAAIGMTVPLVRARFGKDPAIGSSVLLTFATDTLGFLIFLGLATLVLL